MKQFLFLCSLLLALGLYTGCGEVASETGEEVSVADLPPSISAYVSQNYQDAEIEHAERSNEDGNVVYEIELDSDVELVFDATGNFLRVDDDD